MIVVEKEKSIGGYQKKFFQLSDIDYANRRLPSGHLMEK
jgi:hypothetical protein